MYTSVCTMANISYNMFQNVGKQRGAKSSNKYVHENESVRFHNVPVDTLNTFNHFLFCEKFWKTKTGMRDHKMVEIYAPKLDKSKAPRRRVFFNLTICKV